MITRETIYAALWAKAIAAKDPRPPGTAYAFNQGVSSRRLKHWDDVPPAQQPCLFMSENTEHPKQVKGLPPTWDINLHLWIYDNCQGDPAALPGQRLNYLLDALDNALAPAGGGGGYQTLGGLVSHCWIAGPIDIYEGYKGMMDQSVVIIPIEIRVPDSSGPV